MRNLVVICLVCCIATAAFAQSPVRQDVLQALSEIPAPPGTPQDAFDRVVVDRQAIPPRVSADALFATVENRLAAVVAAYEKQEPGSAAAAVPPGMPQDMARLASDPEFRKKMKSMSKEERAQMAMAMAGSATAAGKSAVAPEPPAVQAALDAWQRVARDTQAEFERGVARQKAAVAAEEADERAHDEIEAWKSAQIAALPQISSGEMSAPDPAAVRVVVREAVKRHLAVAQKRLDAFATAWPKSRDHVKERYGDFHARLVACDYAGDSPNFATRKILSDGQMTLLKDIEAEAKAVRREYEVAAQWVARCQAMEAQ